MPPDQKSSGSGEVLSTAILASRAGQLLEGAPSGLWCCRPERGEVPPGAPLGLAEVFINVHNAALKDLDEKVLALMRKVEMELQRVDMIMVDEKIRTLTQALKMTTERVSELESRPAQQAAANASVEGKMTPSFSLQPLAGDLAVAEKPLPELTTEDVDIKMPAAADEQEATSELRGGALDLSENYPLCESLWETCVFIGHPAVGWDVTLVSLFGVLVNTFVQVGFTVFVSQTMTEDPVSSEQLDGLLRFRASIAHNAKWADAATHRSLASQLCDTDDRLPLAGGQMGLYADIQDFLAKAHPLCLMANLCWTAIIMRDLIMSFKYAAALRSIPRGPLTLSASGGTGGEPVSGIKIESISLLRVVLLHFFVVLPKLAIALYLGFTGIEFLTVTANMGDLLLNAMALAFVIDVDSLFFSIFAPSRIKSLVALTEPMQIRYRPLCCHAGVTVISILLLGSAMAAVETEYLGPFFKRLEQAKDIMCSGNVDFVSAVNPATGIMHISRSSPVLHDWTPAEYHVLQAAHPYIHDVRGWHVPETLVSYSSSNFTEAKITWSFGHADFISEAAYSEVDFQTVLKMDSASTMQAAETLACEDSVAGQSEKALVNHLQHILQNESVHGCDPADTWMVELCSLQNMSMLRAICPLTCGCHDFMAEQLGFFAGPHWGCPLHCTSLMTAYSEYALKSGYYTPCEDHSVADWLGPSYKSMLVKYFEGIYEFLHHMWDEFKDQLAHTVDHYGVDAFGLPVEAHTDFRNHILSGGIVETSFNGDWEIMEGYKHPRNLTGCDYWASWEIQLIFGLDFCHVGEFRSLRFFCPEACHCDKTSPECPLACSKDAAALPAHSGIPGAHGAAQPAAQSGSTGGHSASAGGGH
eukprot:TRINITY_DN10469_c0_g2_i2.p1 TRINITY_DN10469_c0_g2~~TRINITY_DN10469_c0_g2_i2.p1  ORF type:complete len:893 (-),score=139.33 TRINITY_DN10469_c0_g2_i2:228-2837(-)